VIVNANAQSPFQKHGTLSYVL